MADNRGTSGILADLAAERVDEPPDLAALETALATDPAGLHDALRTLASRTLERELARPRPTAFAALASYAHQLGELGHDDEVLNYFRGYFIALDLALRAGLRDVVAAPEPAGVQALANRLRDETDRGSLGAATAVRSLVGQVLSLCDRDSAAEEFRPIRSGPAGDLVRFYYRDSGALTYYRERELSAISREAGREIVRSITPVREGPARSTVGIGVSVDPAFFRIYAGWLYFYAQQLHDLDFNLFLCGDEAATDEVLFDADNFSEGLGRLNLSGVPENVHVYRVPVPSYVRRPRTFFACARFYAAELMLDRYANVYLMDADLSLMDNPRDYFEAIREVTFGVPQTTNTVSLSAWRRFAAGNIALSRRVLDTPLLELLQTYAAHGLRHGADWMLDQNALAFAVEQDGSRTFRPLNSFDRPFVTSRFMSTWEGNFRRARKSLDRPLGVDR